MEGHNNFVKIDSLKTWASKTSLFCKVYNYEVISLVADIIQVGVW